MVEESKVPASQESLESLDDMVPNPDKLNEFICPVSMCQMRDPVVAGDGHTYERECITRIIEEGGKSPLTGEPFAHKWLTVNHNLRKVMQDKGCRLKPDAVTAVRIGEDEGVTRMRARLEARMDVAVRTVETEMRRLRLFVAEEDGSDGDDVVPAVEFMCPVCVPGSGKPLGHAGPHRRRPLTP